MKNITDHGFDLDYFNETEIKELQNACTHRIKDGVTKTDVRHANMIDRLRKTMEERS